MQEAIVAFAKRIAERVAQVEGVNAVGLGGSHARGASDDKSDIDLGLYYHGRRPFSIDALNKMARELDDRRLPNLMWDFGSWGGPWVNGGGWLQVEGRKVDLIYRDIERVEEVIAECRNGTVTCHYQLGHPHGFYNHMYMGEAHYVLSLYDPEGELRRLKQLTRPYPEALRRRLIEKHLLDARFEGLAWKPAERGDTYCVAGCLFRSVGFMIQALFALNRRYFINEKGALRTVESFDYKPAEFVGTVVELLGQPGNTAAELKRSVELLERLLGEVQGLCGELSAPAGSLRAPHLP